MDDRAKRDRGTIDRPAGTAEDVDLAAVLRGVADRIDAVLGAGASSSIGEEVGPPHQAAAVAAWSSVVGGGATSGEDRARRAALATTVLRIGADGSLGVVDESEKPGRESSGPDRARRLDGNAVDTSTEEGLPPTGATSSASRTGTTADVDARLRGARERLSRRRAAITLEKRSASGPAWRRIDRRRIVHRVLIAAAIVSVSVVASLLAT